MTPGSGAPHDVVNPGKGPIPCRVLLDSTHISSYLWSCSGRPVACQPQTGTYHWITIVGSCSLVRDGERIQTLVAQLSAQWPRGAPLHPTTCFHTYPFPRSAAHPAYRSLWKNYAPNSILRYATAHFCKLSELPLTGRTASNYSSAPRSRSAEKDQRVTRTCQSTKDRNRTGGK